MSNCVGCRAEVDTETYLQNDYFCVGCMNMEDKFKETKCARCRHRKHETKCEATRFRDGSKCDCMEKS